MLNWTWIRNQQTMADGPNPTYHFVNKVFLEKAMLICLHISYGAFPLQWQSWDIASENNMACEPKMFTVHLQKMLGSTCVRRAAGCNPWGIPKDLQDTVGHNELVSPYSLQTVEVKMNFKRKKEKSIFLNAAYGMGRGWACCPQGFYD